MISQKLKKSVKIVKVVKPKDITEIVTDYPSACKVLGIKPKLPDLSMLPAKHRKHFFADIILTTIIEAWNQGWVADLTNPDQKKYFVFYCTKKDAKHPSGLGFSVKYYYYTITAPFVGVRHFFKNSTLALKATEILGKYYQDYLFLGVPLKRVGLSVPIFSDKNRKRISTTIPNAKKK